MVERTGSTTRFFLTTFAITWGLQVPGVLAQRGMLPGNPNHYLPLVGLGILGPLLAATILTWRDGGRQSVRKLYGRLLVGGVRLRWVLIALVVPGVLVTALLGLLNLAGRQGPIAYVPSVGGIFFGLVISVTEEIGWRGYALPRLQARWGAFGAAGLLGVLWYLWHIPMFMGMGVPLNLVLVMLLYLWGASLLLTWLYNKGRSGLILAVLAHFGMHLNNSHRALPDDVAPLIVQAIVYAGLGLLVMRAPLLRGATKNALDVRFRNAAS